MESRWGVDLGCGIDFSCGMSVDSCVVVIVPTDKVEGYSCGFLFLSPFIFWLSKVVDKYG